MSLSSQLQSCAALAMRWRAAEVNAWPHALAAVTQAAADAANATWFPLYRLMFNGAPPEQPADAAIWLRSIATALEEFLRGASLGEFERRVALLWVFHGHVSLDAAASPAWTPLAALLCTLHRYYRQFVADVNGVLDAARVPIEAKLKDHVKLAKWEVRLSTPPFVSLLQPISVRLRHTCRQHVPRDCIHLRGSLGGCHDTVRVHPILSQHPSLSLAKCAHPHAAAPRIVGITRCALQVSATTGCCTGCCIAGKRFWPAQLRGYLSPPLMLSAAQKSWKAALPRLLFRPLTSPSLTALLQSLLLSMTPRQLMEQSGTRMRKPLRPAQQQPRRCSSRPHRRRTSHALCSSQHGSALFWEVLFHLASPSDLLGPVASKTSAPRWYPALQPCVLTATRPGR